MADGLQPLQRAPAEAALDAQALFATGVAEARRLASATWTDHNTHDPGITMLEGLAFALAELGYRATLPIADLVAETASGPPPPAEPRDAPEPPEPAGAFRRASACLPNAALTERDWRKLLIDLPGVKNAWRLPHRDALLYADTVAKRLRTAHPGTPGVREVRLGGLFDVLVDFMDGVDTAAERAAVLRRVRDRVERWRVLGEDVVTIAAVPTRDHALCVEAEIATDADAADTAARLLFACETLLAPAVPSRELQALRARGLPVDAVFDGPLLENGFIADADVDASTLPAELRLSDLISVLMDVPGVKSLRDVALQPVDDAGGVPGPVAVADPWRVPVPPNTLPRLSAAFGRVVLTRRGVPVAGWNVAQMPAAVRTRLDALREAARQALETPRDREWPLPPGRRRDVRSHRSWLLDLPAVYGVRPGALPANAGGERRAQVLQLQGYGLLLDQLIADAGATLADAPTLLSADAERLRALARTLRDAPEAARTRSAQLVTSNPGATQLYPPGFDETQLARLGETAAQAVARTHRVLDHLLARIGETVADDAEVGATTFGRGRADVAADKAAFLADAPRLARQRAVAFEQRPEDPGRVWNTANVSGFERRLCALLGIADATRRNLATVPHQFYPEIDATPGDEFRFRLRDRVTDEIVLSSSTHYASEAAAREEMMLAVERGKSAGAYQRRVTSDGRHYFNVVDAEGEIIARRIEYWADPADMEAAIAALREQLREDSGEGLHLIEHVLLRPRDADDPLMPICVDPGCSDCADDDPYSWRVSVVLPADAGRFRNAGFRGFVEALIRRELPAQLMPKVCWVSSDDMARVDAAWRDWLEVHAGFSEVDRPGKLGRLIDALFTVRNVHPSARLFDCAADEAKPYFVLGRTALGTVSDNPE